MGRKIVNWFYRTLFIFIGLWSLQVLSNSQVVKKKEILMFERSQFPPIAFVEGPYKNMGISDYFDLAIIQELEKYFTIDLREIPNSRLYTFFKNKRDLCAPGMGKTKERENFAVFSPLTGITLAMFIIGDSTILGVNHKSISLRKLIEEDKITLGIRQDSSYGAEIDKILQYGFANHPRSIFQRPGVNSTFALFQMLQTNRIQAYLGSAEEYFWMLKTEKMKHLSKKFKIQRYKIEERINDYNPFYVMCSKSPIGLKAMKIITEKILSSGFKRKEKIMEGARNWIPKDFIKEYEKLVDNALVEDNFYIRK